MNKVKIILYFIISIVCTNCRPIDPLWDTISDLENRFKESIEIFDEERTNEKFFPKSANNEGIEMVMRDDWTSGFFAGELWTMYDLTQDEFWKEKAIEYTLPLEQEKLNSCSEIGLKMYCSYGKAYKLTGNTQYREVLIRSAQTLSTLFKPNIGCIRSLSDDDRAWDFPVLIDNMMSLELLFWAARETGNQMYWDIAVSHAETTMQNHFRSDYYAFQVVDYDFETGSILKKGSISEANNVKSLNIGQAISLYGFTVVFRETGDKRFLKHAENIASYISNYLNLNEFCDISAMAIMASAFYELSTLSESKINYLQRANSIMEKLMEPEMLMDPIENKGFLLKHGGEAKTSNKISKPSICADYFLVEAIARKWRIKGQENTKGNSKSQLSQINKF